MADRRNKPGAMTPRLSDRAKKLAVACMIRLPEVWGAISGTLREDDFPDADRAFTAVIGACRRFFDEHSKLAPMETYETVLRADGAIGRGDVFEDEVDEAVECVRFAFGLPLKDDRSKYVGYAMGVFKQWTHEAVGGKLHNFLGRSSSVPTNLSAVLSDAQQELQIGPSDQTFEVPFEIDWHEKKGLTLRSTGVGVFDKFLRGGDHGGEVYGFVGPYGSWKTLNAVQLTCEAVKQAAAYVQAPDWDGRWPYSVLVSYEAPLKSANSIGELQIRLLSYLAHVNKDEIEKARGQKDFSTAGKLKDYEREIWKDRLAADKHVRGEWERINRATGMMNRHLHVLDLSQKGSGYVFEVESAMAAFIREKTAKKQKPFFNFFYLDYVALMVDRYVMAQGLDEKAKAGLIQQTPQNFKSKIGLPYNVPVWLNNQLNGVANSKGPTARLSHADARGCKSWGENLDFSFIAHKPDGFVGRLDCDKHRRSPPMPEALIRVDGAFSRVSDASRDYEIVGNRITEKAISSSLSPPGSGHVSARQDTNWLGD